MLRKYFDLPATFIPDKETEDLIRQILKLAGNELKQIENDLKQAENELANGLIKNPALFWRMVKFVNAHRLREPELGAFTASLVSLSLIENDARDAIVDYFFDHPGAFNQEDPWTLRRMICWILTLRNLEHRICDDQLTIFEVNRKSSEFLDLLKYPAICNAADSNDGACGNTKDAIKSRRSLNDAHNNTLIPATTSFKNVAIYDPRSKIDFSDPAIYALFALMGMLDNCRASVPVSFSEERMEGFEKCLKVLNKNGNFYGITSLNENSVLLRHSGLRERVGRESRFLSVEFTSERDQSIELLAYIKGLKLESVRLRISNLSIAYWHEIAASIRDTSMTGSPGRRGVTSSHNSQANTSDYHSMAGRASKIRARKTVIEQLTIEGVDRQLTAKDLRKMEECDVERLCLAARMRTPDDDPLLSTELKNLKILHLKNLFYNRFDLAERIKRLSIETLIIELSGSINSDLNLIPFLKIVLQSKGAQTLIVNIVAEDVYDYQVAIHSIASRHVVLCHNFEFLEFIAKGN